MTMLPGMSPPMAPPSPSQWLPQIERAVQQLQREASLRQAAQQAGQQAPPQQPEPLDGEVPGEGYLFARDPKTRQAALVETTPEFVRAALLRAIEVCAQDALLPYGEHTPKELGQAVLAFSQAYLLLDPSVDQNGVPLKHHIELNAAAQAIATENKPKSEELRAARGQRPRPQPRVGA